MAFKDITKILYDGSIRIDYKDKAHRYYAYPRIDTKLSETDPKAWGKNLYPKGTTTLINDTLEKKGLRTWPMGMALRELFGFYNFVNDKGKDMLGFTKDTGELWEDGKLRTLTQEEALPIIKSASEAYIRRQKKGADIGNVVHDAIEHYVRGLPFDIGEQYMWNIKEVHADDTNRIQDKLRKGKIDETTATRKTKEADAVMEAALESFEKDVEQAEAAYQQFLVWWNDKEPTLIAAEDILYSKKFNVSGTFDALISLDRKHHPVPDRMPDEEELVITADWKTSNASKSKTAAMPQGINYQYFIQLAIYEMIRREMGLTPAHDLLNVSARKDGGFDTIFASELGLTVDECIAWAKATITCYQFGADTKKALLKLGGV